MRGRRNPQLSMLAFVDLDARIPAHHPLRVVKRLADRALSELSPVFDHIYAVGGRPSIPPSGCSRRACSSPSTRSAPSARAGLSTSHARRGQELQHPGVHR